LKLTVQLLDRLNIQGDLDRIPEHDPGFKGLIPADPKVSPVNLGYGRKASSRIAPGIVANAFEGGLQNHLAGYPLQAEIPGDLELRGAQGLDLPADEEDRRVGRHIKEIRGAQMGITLGITSIDTGSINLHLNDCR
jgi:hypothetical protein